MELDAKMNANRKTLYRAILIDSANIAEFNKGRTQMYFLLSFGLFGSIPIWI